MKYRSALVYRVTEARRCLDAVTSAKATVIALIISRARRHSDARAPANAVRTRNAKSSIIRQSAPARK
jgi:hypothetical protein